MPDISTGALCRCRCRADVHRAEFPSYPVTQDTVMVEGWLVECTAPGCACLQFTEVSSG